MESAPLTIRKKTQPADATPTTKARWFDRIDDTTAADDFVANTLKPPPTPPAPIDAVTVQGFFNRLSGDEPPSS